MAVDPVCQMDVEEEHAAATSLHDGIMYYFCAKGCKDTFDKEPEKYVSPAA